MEHAGHQLLAHRKGRARGPGSDDAAEALGAGRHRLALAYLTGAGPARPSPAVLIALHQALIDPTLVHRVLAARRRGAQLARNLAVHGRSPRDIVRDPAFDWGGEGSARAGAGVTQRKAEDDAPLVEGDVQEIAGAGTADAGERLPHAETIQRAFGRHQIGDAVAHTGGAAHDACDALSARAFTSGNHVAFKADPDLHLAAHEAAHVVQQRAGAVRRKGLGEAGGADEQHADRVADAVVRGESAERLLSAVVGEPAVGGAALATPGTAPRTAQRAVQRSPEAEASSTTRPHRERGVITFVTGAGGYFALALEYWRQSGRTSVPPVTSCRSMRAIIHYLATHPTFRNQPWGEINLVTHANEQGDTSLAVRDGGLRPDGRSGMTPAQLREALAHGEFDQLPATVVDGETSINVIGCALGNSDEMMGLLGQAFGNRNGARPGVYAPRHLETYARDSSGTPVREYLTRFWYVTLDLNEPQDIDHLVARFRERYPDQQQDWRALLAHHRHDTHTHQTFRWPSGEHGTDGSGRFEWVVPGRSREDTAGWTRYLVAAGRSSESGIASLHVRSQRREESIITRGYAPSYREAIEYDVHYRGGAHEEGLFTYETVYRPPRSDEEWQQMILTHPLFAQHAAGPNQTNLDVLRTFHFTDRRIHVEGPDTPGARRRMWLSIDGQRPLVRIEVPYSDAQGNHNPSRSDGNAYGHVGGTGSGGGGTAPANAGP